MLNKLKVLQESFIPVSLILVTLFMGLLFVQYQVVSESDQITVISIPETPEGQSGAVYTDTENVENGDSLLEVASTREGSSQGAMTAQGELKSAEQSARETVAKERTSAHLNNLGVILYKQGRWKEALEVLREALQVKPVYERVRFNLGMVLSRLQRPQEALREFQAQIKSIPAHYEAHYNSGILLLNQERYPEALTYFRQAAELSSGKRKAAALLRQALTLIRQDSKQKKEVSRLLEATLRLQPDNISARYWLGRQEPDTPAGRAKAKTYYETILNLVPNDGPTLIQVSRIQSAEGQPIEAEQTLAHALQTNPNSRTVHFHAGLLMMERKHWAEAALHFEWVTQKYPDDAIAYFNLARSSFGAKLYDKALENYQKALELRKGTYPEAHLNMGNVYKAKKKYTEAIKSYQAALKQKPSYPEAWFNLGLAHLRDNKMELAETEFRNALKARPDYEEAWYNLGLIYSRTGKDNDSIQAYQQALAIKPDYSRAQLNLAVMWSRNNDDAKAVALYREVLAADPTHTTAWLNLSFALSGLGHYEDADNALRNVLKLEPDNIKARRQQAKVALARNRPDEAVSLMETAVEMEPDNALLRVELAEALRASNKIQAAVAELEKALRLNPQSDSIRKNLEAVKKAL
ncbi:MAG: tetratricopeptide repeat protein [Deltaproteobacteria bacterium]|nr:tetratricopeptide repeat protein [Deltaproteobacteria bacterium]